MNTAHTPVLRNCLQMICEQEKKKAKSAMHVFFAITHSICIMSGKIVQRYLLIILCTLKERIICGPSKKKDNSAL